MCTMVSIDDEEWDRILVDADLDVAARLAVAQTRTVFRKNCGTDACLWKPIHTLASFQRRENQSNKSLTTEIKRIKKAGHDEQNERALIASAEARHATALAAIKAERDSFSFDVGPHVAAMTAHLKKFNNIAVLYADHDPSFKKMKETRTKLTKLENEWTKTAHYCWQARPAWASIEKKTTTFENQYYLELLRDQGFMKATRGDMHFTDVQRMIKFANERHQRKYAGLLKQLAYVMGWLMLYLEMHLFLKGCIEPEIQKSDPSLKADTAHKLCGDENFDRRLQPRIEVIKLINRTKPFLGKTPFTDDQATAGFYTNHC